MFTKVTHNLLDPRFNQALFAASQAFDRVIGTKSQRPEGAEDEPASVGHRVIGTKSKRPVEEGAEDEPDDVDRVLGAKSKRAISEDDASASSGRPTSSGPAGVKRAKKETTESSEPAFDFLFRLKYLLPGDKIVLAAAELNKKPAQPTDDEEKLSAAQILVTDRSCTLLADGTLQDSLGRVFAGTKIWLTTMATHAGLASTSHAYTVVSKYRPLDLRRERAGVRTSLSSLRELALKEAAQLVATASAAVQVPASAAVVAAPVVAAPAPAPVAAPAPAPVAAPAPAPEAAPVEAAPVEAAPAPAPSPMVAASVAAPVAPAPAPAPVAAPVVAAPVVAAPVVPAPAPAPVAAPVAAPVVAASAPAPAPSPMVAEPVVAAPAPAPVRAKRFGDGFEDMIGTADRSPVHRPVHQDEDDAEMASQAEEEDAPIVEYV